MSNWTIFINGKQKSLDNFEYLNYLLEQSRKAIQDFNKIHMRYIIWDLEEFKENTSLFYSVHKIIIESEIKTLTRLLQYEHIKNT